MTAAVAILSGILCLCLYNANADYVGAVAEHTAYDGIYDESTASKLNKNIELYEAFTALAAEYKVQVLVFPEFGLTPGPAKQRSDFYQ
jgi:phage terminase large subunit